MRRKLAPEVPLVPLELLRIRLFSLSVAMSVCSLTGEMAVLVALPFEIERLEHSAVATRFRMPLWPVTVDIAAPIADVPDDLVADQGADLGL